VKNSQHDKTFAIETVLKHVSRAKDLQHNLAIFIAAGNRPSQLRVRGKHLHLVDNFLGDN
jgi:hypothetical protein